jgi:single-strand DNA-binding protein
MSEHNLVVLRGTVSGEPRARDLPSGTTLVQLDLTTRDDAGTQSVPVAWFDPPAAAADLATGTDVVVVGTVRRRFFRAGGVTQSRTEVVADRVVVARRAKEVQRTLDQATRWLANLAP